MRISSMNTFLAGLLLLPLSSMAIGPSSCKEQTEALETCAETAISSGEGNVLGFCTDQQSELSECLGSVTPDVPLEGDTTLFCAGGLLECYVHLALYDACVGVTNTTTTGSCPRSCIIDGPDQNCDDYDFTFCERQECCTDCNEYMNDYDTCVSNAGSCSVSNPTCTSGAAGFSVSSLGMVATAVVGVWMVIF